MGKATKDFEELFSCLRRHDVKSVIVGAHAVAFHAKPRYTKDIDILIEPSPENAEKVVAALAAFGFGAVGISASDLEAEGKILQLGFPPNRIDLITSIDGVSFEQVWGSRVEGNFGTERVWYIGLEALIANKRAADRPQDRADVDTLMKLGGG
ncbi:MAG TPA: DUF6036 family nucleotidyltransferase [Thermoanaerobaculia bacterium]|nr:DUF6036 family nucleotidyltransferase [Thermoanaerobaculia bacterium]